MIRYSEIPDEVQVIVVMNNGRMYDVLGTLTKPGTVSELRYPCGDLVTGIDPDQVATITIVNTHEDAYYDDRQD